MSWRLYPAFLHSEGHLIDFCLPYRFARALLVLMENKGPFLLLRPWMNCSGWEQPVRSGEAVLSSQSTKWTHKEPLMYSGTQGRTQPTGMLIFCFHQWKPDARRTSSEALRIFLSELPHGNIRKLVRPVGEVGEPCVGEGWFSYFLWHGLWKSQREWISNDGSKLQIWNIFIPSWRSPALMEIILIAWTLVQFFR